MCAEPEQQIDTERDIHQGFTEWRWVRVAAAPVIVVDDEVGGAEGALVVDVGQQRRVGRQLDHLRVALHARHERRLRNRSL